MTYRLCRLYFNRRDDPDGAWSVDAGPGTPELKTKVVVVAGSLIGITQMDFSQHGPAAVSAWIQYRDVEVHVNPEGLVIRPI